MLNINLRTGEIILVKLQFFKLTQYTCAPDGTLSAPIVETRAVIQQKLPGNCLSQTTVSVIYYEPRQ